MRYGQGARVPIPTEEQIAGADAQENEIVACAALMKGPLLYMNIAFHNGYISTVAVGPAGGPRLLRALKALVPDGPTTGVSEVTEGDRGREVQEGHMSG
jgi:hypothetical protein